MRTQGGPVQASIILGPSVGEGFLEEEVRAEFGVVTQSMRAPPTPARVWG